ncbi:MAG: hypothetical protein LLF97_07130 [Planctomycetaceae bacterium]|nr:hypothetical protein [Planctomycetaceae bacterium]
MDRPKTLLVQLPVPPPGMEPVEGNVPLASAFLKLFAERRGLGRHSGNPQRFECLVSRAAKYIRS